MENPWLIDPLHISIRLFLAVLLGGLVGLEREASSHAAGLRTHILVCVGSTLIMLLSIYGFRDFVGEPNVRVDPSRLAAQVISGIGFLGAGTILFNGRSITGLTTAASLWVVAAIGLAAGAGFYFASVLACLLVLISLWILNKVERKYFGGKRVYSIHIKAIDQPGSLGKIFALLGSRKVQIRKIRLEEASGEGSAVQMTFAVTVPKASVLPRVLEDLRKLGGVIGVSVE